jgi:hypothetical protein
VSAGGKRPAKPDPFRRVEVRNLGDAHVAFRAANTPRDVVIPPRGKVFLAADEIMAQIYAGNRLFVGSDGKGSHAGVFVEDEAVREEAGFEGQEALDLEAIRALLEATPSEGLRAALEEKIVTGPEKRRLRSALESGEINDHGKVMIARSHLGLAID